MCVFFDDAIWADLVLSKAYLPSGPCFRVMWRVMGRCVREVGSGGSGVQRSLKGRARHPGKSGQGRNGVWMEPKRKKTKETRQTGQGKIKVRTWGDGGGPLLFRARSAKPLAARAAKINAVGLSVCCRYCTGDRRWLFDGCSP